MAEGCENAMALWREVREQGFAGTHRQVHRFVAERRTMPTPGYGAPMARKGRARRSRGGQGLAVALTEATHVAAGAADGGLVRLRGSHDGSG